MPVSHLTTSASGLWELVLERLEDEGYTFNRLTTTPAEFLAATVSDLTGLNYSNLTTPYSQLLEVLHNHLADTNLFKETSSTAQLLAGIANALEGGVAAGEILLSNSTIPETAEVNDVVGTLSVTGATGSPVFTLDDDAGGLFALNGADVVVAAALDSETEPSPEITVSVSGVTPAIAPTLFVIQVMDIGVPGALDFSSADFSGLLVLLDDI